jgi:hypothetical protein
MTMASGRIDFASRGVRLKKQKELAWCYAAVASIVSNWLNNNRGWYPCQIVARNLEEKLLMTGATAVAKAGACNCCAKRRPAACTGVYAVGRVSEVMGYLGITYHRGNGMPTSDTVAAEINAGRPIMIALTRKGGAGHVALLIGYDDTPRDGDLDRTDMYTLYDPAALNIPIFKERVDGETMTLNLTHAELYARYPTPKYQVQYHYINLALGGGGLNAPPAWATLEE